jgi:hypothetical protein
MARAIIVRCDPRPDVIGRVVEAEYCRTLYGYLEDGVSCYPISRLFNVYPPVISHQYQNSILFDEPSLCFLPPEEETLLELIIEHFTD